jgi:hypothetical protein
MSEDQIQASHRHCIISLNTNGNPPMKPQDLTNILARYPLVNIVFIQDHPAQSIDGQINVCLVAHWALRKAAHPFCEVIDRREVAGSTSNGILWNPAQWEKNSIELEFPQAIDQNRFLSVFLQSTDSVNRLGGTTTPAKFIACNYHGPNKGRNGKQLTDDTKLGHLRIILTNLKTKSVENACPVVLGGDTNIRGPLVKKLADELTDGEVEVGKGSIKLNISFNCLEISVLDI